jgi:hypothetical protein
LHLRFREEVAATMGDARRVRAVWDRVCFAPSMMDRERSVAEGAAEPERICCPDDLCVGALDETGRCGTCGARFAQYARARGEDSGASSELPVAHEATEASGARDGGEREAGVERQRFDEDEASLAEDREGEAREDEALRDRVCCPDDLCTGVIGEGGVCGTCGRVTSGEVIAR